MSTLAGSPFVIDPDAPGRIAWNVLVSAAAFISVIGIPLVLAFNLGGNPLVAAGDILINFIFVTDIICCFHTAYAEGHYLVRDSGRIRRRYLRTWFLPDLLSALPLFLLSGTAFVILNRAFRFLRLLRLLKVFVLFRTINHFRRTKVSSNLLRMVLMVFWLLLIAHLLSCGFILVGGIAAGLGPGMTYLLAFYWTVTTMSTVGYGDITPDKTNPGQILFTILAQITGVGMYGFVIGNIASVLSNIDISKTLFMERMEKIYSFLRYRRISSGVVKRVDNYYNYLWESRRGHEEAGILADLPQSIRLQIAQELHADIIAKVPLFAGATPSLIRDIVLHLEPTVFTPGDFIIQQGDMGEEMYFINRGSVEVLNADEKAVYTTLNEGTFFGEIALLLKTPRTATVRARSYCDLYALWKSSFDRILTRHPVFAQSIQELAEKRKAELAAGKSPVLPC